MLGKQLHLSRTDIPVVEPSIGTLWLNWCFDDVEYLGDLSYKVTV